jgi:hypothetical protein
VLSFLQACCLVLLTRTASSRPGCLFHRGDWSVDPGSVLQLLGESPGLVDFLLELLVQDPIQEQPSTAAHLSTPTSSTCSGSVISLEAQSLDDEDSAWSTLETESSYEDECIASTSPPLIGRYKQDASKIESGQAIEFLELARSRLSHGDYASLLEVFCSLHKVEEVTEKMEMEIWALVSLDSELTLSFQKLFPSLA